MTIRDLEDATVAYQLAKEANDKDLLAEADEKLLKAEIKTRRRKKLPTTRKHYAKK